MVCWDNIALFLWIAVVWCFSTIAYPSFVLRRFFKETPFSNRILYYQVISVLYCMFVTYILGFCRIYYSATIFLAYFGVPFLVVLIVDRKKWKQRFHRFSQGVDDFLAGRYGLKLFLHNLRQRVKKAMKEKLDSIDKREKIEWILFFVILLIGIAYFGYYRFTHYNYAASDEEVHLYWVQSLKNRNIFPSGMYPHGMHSILALLCCLIPTFEVKLVLCFSPLIVALNMLSLFVLMKKLAKNHLSSVFAMAFFCVNGLFNTIAYSRFQFVIPMEFGMFAVPILILVLLRLLEENKKEDRFMLLFLICYTLSTHFYVTIIVGVICIVFAFIYLRLIWKKKLFRVVFLYGICGVLLAVIPYGVGLVLGYPFEQSMNWAMGVMKNEDTVSQYNGAIITEEVQYWMLEGGGVYIEMNGEDPMTLTESSDIWSFLIVQGNKQALGSVANSKLAGYILIGIVAFTFLYGMGRRMFRRENAIYNRFFMAISLSMVFLYLLVLLPFINLPEIMDGNRVKVFLYDIFAIEMFFLFEVLGNLVKNQRAKTVFVTGGFCGSIVMLIATDNWERNRYTYCINQEETMRVCLDIMEQEEQYGYTVVSTTNELSVVRYYGYHVEWIDFFQAQAEGKPGDIYTIPTEDVYFIVEKSILDYGMADYEEDGWGNGVVAGISAAKAKEPIEKEYLNPNNINRSRVYQYQRELIMSKAYYWMSEYETYYGDEFTKYYEDENVVIYHLKQNEYALNNLLLQDERW